MTEKPLSRIARARFSGHSEDEIVFVQRRIALPARALLVAVLTPAIVMTITTQIVGGPLADIPRKFWPIVLVMVLLLGGVWMYTRGRPRSPLMVAALDAFVVIDAGFALGGASVLL